MTRFASWMVVAVVATTGVAAHAGPDDPGTPTMASDSAPAAASPPAPSSFVLPKGKLQLDAFLEMSLSSGAVFQPVALAPDLWYGVTDDLTLGLVHSSIGATGFIGGAGEPGYIGADSLCLTGSGGSGSNAAVGCPNVYQDVGVDARYRLQRPFAIDGGIYIRDTSPFELAIKLGISGRWLFGKLVLEAQPSFWVGLTNRNPTVVVGVGSRPNGPINTEELYIPGTLGYLVTPRLELAFQTGAYLPFDRTSTTWAIPIAIAGRYAVTPRFGLGLVFAFPELIGGAGTANGRELTLGGTYAF